eukprot:2773420-Pyramimonas_sp.AAC.1
MSWTCHAGGSHSPQWRPKGVCMLPRDCRDDETWQWWPVRGLGQKDLAQSARSYSNCCRCNWRGKGT